MTLADENKELIKHFIILKNVNWSYYDSVFVWLLPSFYNDIHAYYNSKGSQLIKIYTDEQIIQIDKDLHKKLTYKLGGIKAAQTRMERRSNNTLIWSSPNSIRFSLPKKK